MVLFGEQFCESPRMPSPWSRRRLSSSPHTRRSRLSTEPASSDEDDSEHEGFFSLDLDRVSTQLAPERDGCGNLEYKLIVRPATRLRFQSLVTQCQWRIVQGGGVATYEVGVLDCGALVGLSRGDMRESLTNLSSMAKQLDATLCIRRVIVLELKQQQHLKIHPDDSDLSAAVRRAKIKSDNNHDEGSTTSIRALNEEQARTLLGVGPLDTAPDAWTWHICAATTPPLEPKAPSHGTVQPLSPAMESDDDDDQDKGFGFSLSLDDYAPPLCKSTVSRSAATLSVGSGTPPLIATSRTLTPSGDSSVSSSSSSYASSSSAYSTLSGAPPIVIRLDESRDEVKESHSCSPLTAPFDVLSFTHTDQAKATRLKQAQQTSHKLTARARATLDRRQRRLAQLRAAEVAGAGWAPELPDQIHVQEAPQMEEEQEDSESLLLLAQFGHLLDDDEDECSDAWVPSSVKAAAERKEEEEEENMQPDPRNEAKRRRREVRRTLRQAELAEREEQKRLVNFVQRVYPNTYKEEEETLKVYSASLPAQPTPAAAATTPNALRSVETVAALQQAAQVLLERQAAHTRALEAQLGLRPDTRIIVEAQVLSNNAHQQTYFANLANVPF